MRNTRRRLMPDQFRLLFEATFGLACLIATACGGRTGITEPPPSVNDCVAGWQPITNYRPPLAPTKLVYYNEELYYYINGASTDGNEWAQIEAQPIVGGSARVVLPNIAATDIWLEGDQVLYGWGGGLWQVPSQGGTPTQLIAEQADVLNIGDHALSPTVFVWAKIFVPGVSGYQLWLVPRDGSAPAQVLGAVPGVDWTWFTADSLITAGMGMESNYVTKLDGSAQRSLQLAGAFNAGIDATGVYGIVQNSPDTCVLQRAPVDGSAVQLFWPDKTPTLVPNNIWVNPFGGWFISGGELMDDNALHPSLFFMDARGQVTRAACSATAGPNHAVTRQPAFTADAAYVVEEDFNDPADGSWRIVRVPRP